MATSIKQKLLAFHIERRDANERCMERCNALGRRALGTAFQERFKLHAEAVEFLSNGG